MIKLCSFFDLPIFAQRIGKVLAISNSVPRQWGRIDGKVACLVPEWKDVKLLRDHQIGEEEFVNRYRATIQRRWPQVKAWLDSLASDDEMYLCCWEREGFCHRYLVAKLLRKFRPDLEVRVT